MKAKFEAEKQGAADVVTAQKAGEAAELRAKGDAAATVTKANAEKAAAIAKAEGDARAREVEAKSKVAAITELAEAYKAEGSENPIDDATHYMLAEEIYKSVAQLGSNGGTAFIPFGSEGMASVVATMTGLAEAILSRRKRTGEEPSSTPPTGTAKPN